MSVSPEDFVTNVVDVSAAPVEVRRAHPPGRVAATPTEPQLEVLVVADEGSRRAWSAGLAMLGITSIDVMSSIREARERLRERRPGLTIVDAATVVAAAAGNGEAGAVPLLLALGVDPDDRLVVIGSGTSIGEVQASLRAGARGYLRGHSSDVRIRRDPGPAEGRAGAAVGVPGTAATSVAVGQGIPVADVGGRTRMVSHRELEILQHAADGESNNEIGGALGLSPLTVKSHLSRVGRRLGTGDRAHLVMLALRAGAIS